MAVCVAAVALGACRTTESRTETSLGMRVGSGFFDADRFVDTEDWLDTEIAYTVQFTGRQSQKDMNGSAFGLLAADGAELPEFSDRVDLSISVPLGFGRSNAHTREGRDEIADNLRAVVDGEHDAAYRRVAGRLIDAGYSDAIIRLGHEFNGAWAPWSSRTNEEHFIAAWRHVHQLFRSMSSDFTFDWTAVRPTWDEWGPIAYPGDDYVDIVGLDIYWKVTGDQLAWETDVWDRNYLSVLRDHLAFAQIHDKQVSYPEWGLSGADTPRFIEAMRDWFDSLPAEGPGSMSYQAYFNNDGPFSLDKYPLARATYRRLFGGS